MDDPLAKYITLIPLAYNDGSPVTEEVILEFKEQLFALADGWTVAGTVEGAYRMADGKQQIDRSLQFWISIRESRGDELRAVVAELGRRLGQESMYLELTGASVEFVPPSEGHVPPQSMGG
jgi:hypothetical protein